MRQVTRKGLISVVAAGGVLALGGGYAQADSGASGEASNSPGVLSGNSVQAPIHVPVNVCGNTVDVVGLLNPAMGNKCANVSDGPSGSGSDAGGSQADGGASDSPGVGSGNQVQAPVDVPVNVCGNSVTIIGALNPSVGNDCENDSGSSTPEEPNTPQEPEEPEEPEEPQEPEEPDTPSKPDTPHTPSNPDEPNTPGAQNVTPPKGDGGELAATGVDALDVLAPAGVGLLLAGAVLYRRARASA